MSDCPGRHKCHGPANWCDECGDVDLVCDDPRCEVHLRGKERLEKVQKLKPKCDEAAMVLRSLERELHDAERELQRYRTGNVVMVARCEK